MKLKEKIKNYIKKILEVVFNIEFIMYIIMGVLTTLVNIFSFTILLNTFNKGGVEGSTGWKVAEVISFIIAVIFAYITNKIFVFKSKSFTLKVLVKEVSSFFAARVITELINIAMMFVMIDMCGVNTIITKIVTSIVVVALNYVFSKFYIFKNKKNGEKST